MIIIQTKGKPRYSINYPGFMRRHTYALRQCMMSYFCYITGIQIILQKVCPSYVWGMMIIAKLLLYDIILFLGNSMMSYFDLEYDLGLKMYSCFSLLYFFYRTKPLLLVLQSTILLVHTLVFLYHTSSLVLNLYFWYSSLLSCWYVLLFFSTVLILSC
jgi:hypothetical protein